MEPARSLQKEWWLRALAVFQSPRGTFAALRDDSAEAAEARQEPILAIVILAGIAGILTTSLAGRLLDDPNNDSLNVAIWAFFGGAFYGLLVFWLGGLLVYDHRTRDEISQPSALLVAHHADQAHTIDARQPVYRAHQVPSDCVESIDWPA